MGLDLAGQACLQRHAEGINRTDSGGRDDVTQPNAVVAIPLTSVSQKLPQGLLGLIKLWIKVFQKACGFGDYHFHARSADVFRRGLDDLPCEIPRLFWLAALAFFLAV